MYVMVFIVKRSWPASSSPAKSIHHEAHEEHEVILARAFRSLVFMHVMIFMVKRSWPGIRRG
jgi:hypothetical protein